MSNKQRGAVVMSDMHAWKASHINATTLAMIMHFCTSASAASAIQSTGTYRQLAAVQPVWVNLGSILLTVQSPLSNLSRHPGS
jgi:hypothetical protein